jgi:hypothetical protein
MRALAQHELLNLARRRARKLPHDLKPLGPVGLGDLMGVEVRSPRRGSGIATIATSPIAGCR